MWRKGIVETLNIQTEKITFTGSSGLTDLHSTPKICLKHPNQKKTVTYKGY